MNKQTFPIWNFLTSILQETFRIVFPTADLQEDVRTKSFPMAPQVVQRFAILLTLYCGRRIQTSVHSDFRSLNIIGASSILTWV